MMGDEFCTWVNLTIDNHFFPYVKMMNKCGGSSVNEHRHKEVGEGKRRDDLHRWIKHPYEYDDIEDTKGTMHDHRSKV